VVLGLVVGGLVCYLYMKPKDQIGGLEEAKNEVSRPLLPAVLDESAQQEEEPVTVLAGEEEKVSDGLALSDHESGSDSAAKREKEAPPPAPGGKAKAGRDTLGDAGVGLEPSKRGKKGKKGKRGKEDWPTITEEPRVRVVCAAGAKTAIAIPFTRQNWARLTYKAHFDPERPELWCSEASGYIEPGRRSIRSRSCSSRTPRLLSRRRCSSRSAARSRTSPCWHRRERTPRSPTSATAAATGSERAAGGRHPAARAAGNCLSVYFR
jgi:hypothetical protein